MDALKLVKYGIPLDDKVRQHFVEAGLIMREVGRWALTEGVHFGTHSVSPAALNVMTRVMLVSERRAKRGMAATKEKPGGRVTLRAASHITTKRYSRRKPPKGTRPLCTRRVVQEPHSMVMVTAEPTGLIPNLLAAGQPAPS